MDVFLVKGSIRYTPYMGDTEIFDDIRLVKANTATEAEEKYQSWWEAKSSEYSHSYWASSEVLETVE